MYKRQTPFSLEADTTCVKCGHQVGASCCWHGGVDNAYFFCGQGGLVCDSDPQNPLECVACGGEGQECCIGDCNGELVCSVGPSDAPLTDANSGPIWGVCMADDGTTTKPTVEGAHPDMYYSSDSVFESIESTALERIFECSSACLATVARGRTCRFMLARAF